MQATLSPVSPAQESIRAPQPVTRNIAVDAYRGWVMLLMMAEVLELGARGARFPRQLILGVSGLQPDPRGVGRLFAARYDSAVVFVPGGRGAALLHRQPPG